MASSGRMLLLRSGRGLQQAAAPSNALGRMRAGAALGQCRSIYADPQGKSYEREGLVMYVPVRNGFGCHRFEMPGMPGWS